MRNAAEPQAGSVQPCLSDLARENLSPAVTGRYRTEGGNGKRLKVVAPITHPEFATEGSAVNSLAYNFSTMPG
jgi:hypothetical protein